MNAEYFEEAKRRRLENFSRAIGERDAVGALRKHGPGVVREMGLAGFLPGSKLETILVHNGIVEADTLVKAPDIPEAFYEATRELGDKTGYLLGRKTISRSRVLGMLGGFGGLLMLAGCKSVSRPNLTNPNEDIVVQGTVLTHKLGRRVNGTIEFMETSNGPIYGSGDIVNGDFGPFPLVDLREGRGVDSVRIITSDGFALSAQYSDVSDYIGGQILSRNYLVLDKLPGLPDEYNERNRAVDVGSRNGAGLKVVYRGISGMNFWIDNSTPLPENLVTLVRNAAETTFPLITGGLGVARVEVTDNPISGRNNDGSRHSVVRIGTENKITSRELAGPEIDGGIIEVTPDVTLGELNTLISQLFFFVKPGDVGYTGTVEENNLLGAANTRSLERSGTRTEVSPQGAIIDSYQRQLS